MHFFINLKHFHNFIIHICIVFIAWKIKGRKKQRKKKIIRKISRGFIFVNLPFPKFSRGLILANRRLSNISRGFNFVNLRKICENREHLSTRKLVQLRYVCMCVYAYVCLCVHANMCAFVCVCVYVFCFVLLFSPAVMKLETLLKRIF